MSRLVMWAALAVAAAGAPPLRVWLESTMGLHMLVQLPILAVAGALLGKAWHLATPDGACQRSLAWAQSFNAGGVTGLLAASFIMLLWMVPRSLDMARLSPAVDLLKFGSLPAAGVALAVSWHRLPVIARAVVHLEAIATLGRFGWGYMAADERLCLSYLANDQRLTGELLLWTGGLYAIAVAWRPVFGPLRLPWSGRQAHAGLKEN